MPSWSLGGDTFVHVAQCETLLILCVRFIMAAQRLACLGLNVLNSTFCVPTQVLSFAISLCVWYAVTIIQTVLVIAMTGTATLAKVRLPVKHVRQWSDRSLAIILFSEYIFFFCCCSRIACVWGGAA